MHTMKPTLAVFSFLLSQLTPVYGEKSPSEVTVSDLEMVVSAHFLATEAGEKILADGGTAIDAMIAVQTVLGLVEPQSSGIAGGAFVVYFDAEMGKLTTFDARETAPILATEDRFVDPATSLSLGFRDAWQSALSVGVPGVPRAMEMLHKKFGKLPWADLFEPAKAHAIDGFNVSQRTEDFANALLESNESCEDRLYFRDPVTFAYLINPDCTAKPAGTVLTNPEYADTMDLLAAGGADAFYTGVIAEDIVAKLAGDRNPSGDALLSLEDLAGYEVVEREPICKMYRGMHNVCGMGPPSSGALAVGQILGILENFDLTGPGPTDVDTVHLFTQAGRLAFADRGLYVADTDFITVPVEGMLNDAYLTSRAGLIDMMMDMGTATAGVPPGTFNPAAPQTSSFEAGTSHISIVDQFGNALSMTTTVESIFGNGLMVRGFLLNNQLTDFSFAATDDAGTPIANRVQAKKRPRSSMSPTIVLDKDGALAYVTGSPGGSRIIGYTAHSLVNMLDFGYDPQQAANTPHYQNRNGNTEIEVPEAGITSDYDIAALSAALSARGHTVSERELNSGLSIVKVQADGLLGGFDPRRDGSAGGRLATAAPAVAVVLTEAPAVAPVMMTDAPSGAPVTSGSLIVFVGTVVGVLALFVY
jgi:gamma-glutamyltranspeptidase/glutathione hydrolase